MGRTKSLQILSPFEILSNILAPPAHPVVSNNALQKLGIILSTELAFHTLAHKDPKCPSWLLPKRVPWQEHQSTNCSQHQGHQHQGTVQRNSVWRFVQKQRVTLCLAWQMAHLTSFPLSGVQSTQQLLRYLKLCVWILGKTEHFSSKKQDFWPNLMYNLILDPNLEQIYWGQTLCWPIQIQ